MIFLFRSTVIGCYLNEICFLEKEGAFLMLDLLEVNNNNNNNNWEEMFSLLNSCSQRFTFQSCPVSMQNVVMGIIVDLMENKNVSF